MYRFSLLILLSIMFGLSAWAQDESQSGSQELEQAEPETENEVEPEVEPEAEPEAEPEEPEEPAVDDEFYQDIDDEDFRPTEDVPADQSIAFPTDI